jgi:hypothetical protein
MRAPLEACIALFEGWKVLNNATRDDKTKFYNLPSSAGGLLRKRYFWRL